MSSPKDQFRSHPPSAALGGSGRSKRRSTAFTRATSSRGLKGLRNVIVRTQFETEHAIRLTAFRSEKNYRHRSEAGVCRICRQSSRPSLPGTMISSMKNAGRCRSASVTNRGARRVHAHVEALALQVMPHQSRNIRIVLHHEDAWFHGSIVAATSGVYPAPSGDCGAWSVIFIRL